MRSPKPARAENPLGNTRRSAKAYLYLLPAFAVLAVFVVYPILMTLRMGFYQSYVYLTDTGTGFGLNSFRYVLPIRFRAGRAQHHVYCSGGRTYHDCALPGGSPAHQFPASDQGTVSDTLFSPLCHLHPGHRPGVPLALPLGIRLHQLFSGVFGAGATEVAVRSQPDHCGGDHFYHLERYGV